MVSWKGRWCPQHWGHWWHWVGRDVGVARVGNIGGVGVGNDVGGIGLEVTLVALRLKGPWCPQGGEHWCHWVEGTMVALGLKNVGVPSFGDIGDIGAAGRRCGWAIMALWRPLCHYGGHCALMATIVPLWRPLFPYGDHCVLMAAIVPLWRPLCPYGCHCALMAAIVPLW